MALIELCLEALVVANPYRGNPQVAEPLISHPPYLATRHWIVATQYRCTWSQPCDCDCEKAADTGTTEGRGLNETE